jgi:hypothetical protein
LSYYYVELTMVGLDLRILELRLHTNTNTLARYSIPTIVRVAT